VFLRTWDGEIQRNDTGEIVQVFLKHYVTTSPGKEERLEHLDAIKNGALGIGIE
jgi:hypothetical protein